MDIGTLIGYLKLEDAFSGTLEQVSNKFQKVGGDIQKAGSALSLGITAPLVAAAGASLAFSGSFEASMTKLVTLAGVSANEIQGVKDKILELAPATGIGPLALADAMTKVSSTVSDTKVALQILEISAKGSASGLGEAVDVASALTSVINSYGSQNITAAHAADVLTQAVKDGGAEAKELAPVLANVVPIASQMGVSFEEVAANIATVTKLGTPASEAVTQLSSVLSAMLHDTTKSRDALAAIGITMDDVRKAVKERGLADTLQTLSDKFKGNETQLIKIFPRIEAFRNIMATAGSQGATYAEVLENIKHSSDGAGVALGAFQAMQGTQVQTWKQLSAAAQAIAIELGDALAPALKKVLESTKPLIESVKSAVQWFAALPDPIRNTVIGALAFAAAIGPIVLTLGAFVSAVGSLIPLIGVMGGALAIATGPIGLVALAVVGLVAAVVHFKSEMAGLQNKNDSKYFTETGKAAEALGNQVKAVGDAAPPLVNGFSLVIPAFAKAGEAAKNAGGDIKHVGNTIVQTRKQAEDAAEELKKNQEAWKEYGSIAIDIEQKLGGAVVQAIEYDLKRGITQSNLARVYGVTLEQIGAVEQKIKDETAAARVAAKVHDKVEKGVFGLQESVGALSTAEIKADKEFVEHNEIMQKVYDLNMQARDGFDQVGVSLENVGQKSNEIEVLKQHIIEVDNTLSGRLKTTLLNFPSLLIQAFTGGGSVIGALNALGTQIYQQVTLHLSDAAKASIGFGSAITAAAGHASGLGTVANTAVSIGTGLAGAAVAGSAWGGSMAAAGIAGSVALGAATLGIGLAAVGVVALIKHFSGVSQAVKDARAEVGKFEDSILSTVTASQLSEAGNQRWAAVVISVRDSYLAVGKSSAEAEADVKALWESSQKGGVAAQQAIAKINEALATQKEIMNTVHSMGATSRTELQALADKAKAAFDYMARSGEYSAAQVTKAWRDSAHATAIAFGDAAAIAQQAATDAGFHTRAELEETAKKAEQMYEYMRDSGLYTAAEIQKAWQAAQDAQNAAFDNSSSGIANLAEQYTALTQIVNKGASAEEIRVLQAQSDAQLEVLHQQALTQLGLNGLTAEQAAAAWQTALDNIRINEIHIPVVFDTPALPTGNSTSTTVDSGGNSASNSFGSSSSSSNILPFVVRGNTTKPTMISGSQNFATTSAAASTGTNASNSSNQDLIDVMNLLRTDISGKLPRAVARSVSDALTSIRTAS